MADREVEVFALFSESVNGFNLQEAIEILRDMKLGSVFPLSVRYPYTGILIIGVKEDLLNRVFSDLGKLEFIKLADVLPQKVDPSGLSSCSLKMKSSIEKVKKETADFLNISEEEVYNLVEVLPLEARIMTLSMAVAYLSSLMDGQSSLEWLKMPNEHFQNLSPLDLLSSKSGQEKLFLHLNDWISRSPFRR